MIIESEAPDAHVEEDENYFVSMTDMMVGILFIFVIMLMIFALNFREQTDESQEKIEQLRRVNEVADQVRRRLDELRRDVHNELAAMDETNRARSLLLQDIRRQLQEQGLEVQIDEANGVLRLTEAAIRFKSDSSALADQERRNVGIVARVLANVLPAYAYADCLPTDAAPCPAPTRGAAIETVFIEGHTDVTGRDERNWQLSTERAVNTYRVLEADAPGLRALRNRSGREILSVSGYSSTRPIADGGGVEDHDVNRRIDLRFVMEVDPKKRLQDILVLTDDMQGQLVRLQEAVEQAQ
jgi:chemotaxis protein MotB